ncbi:hypothetical protein ACFRFU_47525 [Streptomyces sp. NPDC056704]|uniref:hypothetical protein n=1 Tax=Streptomyces TaxID=1883 RepID=UPI0036A0713E
MAVLAVLIPPFMLGLVLALGRYEELLLLEKDTDRAAPAVTPTEPTTVPAASPAPSLRISAPSIAYGSPRLLDVGLPQV